MPHIRTVPYDAADGILRAEYDAALQRAGKVFNVVSIQSLHPRVLRASIALYTALMMGPGALPRWTRELLAVVVSRTNGCHYCTRGHGNDLRDALAAAGLDPQLSRVAMDDYRNADLEAPVRALLDFAVALTLRPNGGGDAAVTALRDVGWSDEAILEAVEIVGFFNYYNRLVDALGVEPEPDWLDTDQVE
jgi:uncharacterized peroxidase-related enzyme